jgi:hypothetical protein
MMRFSKLTPDGREIDVRELSYRQIAKCPHLIFDPDHYRADGSCKCNDPHETIIREWGYHWDSKRRLWI